MRTIDIGSAVSEILRDTQAEILLLSYKDNIMIVIFY